MNKFFRILASTLILTLIFVSLGCSNGKSVPSIVSNTTSNASIQNNTSGKTTIIVSDQNTTYNYSGQNITLSATIMASNSSVNEGTVTFTVNDTSGNILGVPAIGPVVNGGASASYSLPGKTVPSTYSIYASYKGNNFKPSNGTANLVVSKPATVVTFTSPSVTYSDSGQNIILTAQVTAANSIINEGKVTFSITDSHGSQVGVPVWGMVINGSATSAFSLPAGTPASQYRLEGDYSADNLQNSNGVGSVTVEKEATTIKVPDVISHTTGEQTITLTAMVTTADGSIVNDGTVTFAPWDYWNGSAWTGTHPITVPVKNGIATTPYTMNGIVGWTFSNATYNGGSNFQSCQEDQTDRNIGFGQPN